MEKSVMMEDGKNGEISVMEDGKKNGEISDDGRWEEERRNQ
jgi:hypothetical protein